MAPPPEIPERKSSKKASKINTFSKLRLKHVASLKRLKSRQVSSSSTKSTAETLSDLQTLIDYAHAGIDFEQAKRGKYAKELEDDSSTVDVFLERNQAINERLDKLYVAVQDLERQKWRLEEPKNEASMTEAFAESVMRVLFVDPITQKKRNKTPQSNMRKSAIQIYEAKDAKYPKRLLCCVTGFYVDEEYVNAAHIVPSSYSASIVSYVCGPGAGDRVYSWDNALLMCRGIELALDHGAIVIVPKDLTEDPITTFELRIINKSARNARYLYAKEDDGVVGTFELSHLDGKILTFKNNRRPLKRFLYFRYLISLLYSKKYADHKHVGPAWQSLISNNPWPTIRGYLKNSFLLRYAQEAGDADEEKIQEIYDSLGGEGEIEPDKRSESRIVFGQVYNSIVEPSSQKIDDISDDETDDEESIAEKADTPSPSSIEKMRRDLIPHEDLV